MRTGITEVAGLQICTSDAWIAGLRNFALIDISTSLPISGKSGHATAATVAGRLGNFRAVNSCEAGVGAAAASNDRTSLSISRVASWTLSALESTLRMIRASDASKARTLSTRRHGLAVTSIPNS